LKVVARGVETIADGIVVTDGEEWRALRALALIADAARIESLQPGWGRRK